MGDEIYLFLKNGMIPEFEALLKIAKVDINSSDILKKAKELCNHQEKIWCEGKETSDELGNCNKPLVSGSKHPKCKGWYKNNWGSMDGAEWGCDYEPDFDCGDCKYGLGDKDPEC